MKKYLFISKILFVASILFTLTGAYAQVGIGTTDPNGNALLDLTSSNQGLLIPRVELTATNSWEPLGEQPADMVEGMMVYNTATTTGDFPVSKGFYYNDGSKWIKAGDAMAGDHTDDAWLNKPLKGYVHLTTKSDGITERPRGTEMVVTDTGFFGIGTDSPTESIQVMAKDADLDMFSFGKEEVTVFHIHAAGGTISNPTAVSDGRGTYNLFAIEAKGYDGEDYRKAGSIVFAVDGGSGLNDMPGKITFLTTPDGTTSLIDRMVIKNNGAVGIGTILPKVRLDVDGMIRAKGFTVDALLALMNPVEGAMAYVTNANITPTYLQEVDSGHDGGAPSPSSIVIPVFFNGDNWVYH